MFRQNPAQYFRQDEHGYDILTNARTGHVWNAGRFEQASVVDLAQRAGALAVSGIPGRFNVVVGFNTPALAQADQRRLDIAALQAAPEHHGAVFQVASNFDCLEGPGRNVTAYAHALAQGEAAAVSAAPGSIARVYAHAGIDLLDGVDELPDLVAGRLNLTVLAPNALQQAAGFNYDDIALGIQQDTQPAFGFITNCGGLHDRCNIAGQRITQIYTSGVNLGLNGRNHDIATIAQKALQAAYEGSIHAAAIYGQQRAGDQPRERQELFLTLVGCGVFGNDLGWVDQALQPCMQFIIDYGLDVTLIVFDGNARSAPGAMTMNNFLALMRQLVADTGGNFEELR